MQLTFNIKKSHLKVISSILSDIAAGLFLSTLTVRNVFVLLSMIIFAIVYTTIAFELEELLEE